MEVWKERWIDMANDLLSRQYASLTGAERFTLMIEAMARHDETEASRLEDTCPRYLYRAEDAEFRDRMRRAFSIATLACLNIQEALGQLRMLATMNELGDVLCGEFAAEMQHAADGTMALGSSQLRAALGEILAQRVMAEWEGLSRFCRDSVGVEPGVLLSAFGLERQDPTAFLTTVPDVQAEEQHYGTRAAEWGRAWAIRFGTTSKG